MTTLQPRPMHLAGERSHGEPFTLTFPVASAAPPAHGGGAASADALSAISREPDGFPLQETALGGLVEVADVVHALPGKATSVSELTAIWSHNHQAKRLAIHKAESWLLELLERTPLDADARQAVPVELGVLLALAAEALR